VLCCAVQQRHDAVPNLGKPDRPGVLTGKLAHRGHGGIDHAIDEAQAAGKRRRDQGIKHPNQCRLRQARRGVQFTEAARGLPSTRNKQRRGRWRTTVGMVTTFKSPKRKART